MTELNSLFQAAQAHYHAGNLTEAEALYRQLLQQRPQNSTLLFWLAAIAAQTDRLDDAIALYQQILTLDPHAAAAHTNLAALLSQQGQQPAAIAHQQAALALLPENPDAHYNLGVALDAGGQFEAAIGHYRRVVELNPQHANAHNNLGVTLCKLGRQPEAIAHYQQAVRLAPAHANAHNNLAVALAQVGDLEAAIGHYQQAIALDPAANIYDNLATALKQRGDLEAAIGHYQQAIKCDPGFASAYDNLGTVFYEQGRLEDAIAQYQQAIAANPSYANAYSNLAATLKDQGKFAAAIARCEQSLRLKPTAHAYNVYGSILSEQGKFAQAIAQFDRAIGLEPTHADTHLNLGIMLLTVGEFRRGFTEYHWRWRTKQCPDLRYPEALWEGLPLNGRTILLTAEQGFGDTIQFVRYAPLVAARGGRVVVACQNVLLRLLQTVPGIDRAVDRTQVDVQTHAHIPLLDLPLMLGTTLETIPAEVPYLTAPVTAPGDRAPLKPFEDACLKIGFVWATNPANATSSQRSCPLAHFLSLLELPGIALYSLQKEVSETEREHLETHDRTVNLAPQLEDFADTAAAIAQLDLVISVDTAVAHLAGALGKPVWTLLPFVADWRWLRDRSDSPWYPTMRLFRQPEAGAWESVFEQVRTALVEVKTGQNPDHDRRAFREALRLSQQGQDDAAIALYRQCDPSNAIAQNNLATLLVRQGQLEGAMSHYRRAIALQPDYAAAYTNLGMALKELNQPDAALPYLQQAIALQPSADAHNSYGCALIDLGQFQAAIAQWQQAIQYDPDCADAHLNLGMTWLLLGDFQRGFAEYHWRWRTKPEFPLRYPEALWDGSPLEGKTILLTAEQGFGDTIQFVRYAALVAAQGGRVVLSCQRELLRLLQTAPGVDQCIDRAIQSVQTHVHAPLLELPYLLNTTLDTIPSVTPYLAAAWHFSIPRSPHRKIGIAWSTSPTSNTTPRRSCSLPNFLSLQDLPGIALYSLQKNPSPGDRALLQTHGVVDLAPQLQDFADTAAAIAQLDLVISVDTAVVHLAGALGKPVWTLLAAIPDWRWQLERADSPWYPTMRLFRQSKPGDWAGVFAQVRSALTTRAENPIAAEPVADRLKHDRLKHGRHGVFLVSDADEMGRSLAAAGEWREQTLNLLQHLIRPGDTVVEVGAGIGAHTVFFANTVGATGTVIAIEPDRLRFQTLCANLALNHLTTVHAYPLATAASLPDITPDRLLACCLLVLRDSALLQDFKQTLQRCQPIVYLHTLDKNHAAIALLESLGYDLYWHPVSSTSSDPTTNSVLGLPRSATIAVDGLERVT